MPRSTRQRCGYGRIDISASRESRERPHSRQLTAVTRRCVEGFVLQNLENCESLLKAVDRTTAGFLAAAHCYHSQICARYRVTDSKAVVESLLKAVDRTTAGISKAYWLGSYGQGWASRVVKPPSAPSVAIGSTAPLSPRSTRQGHVLRNG